MIKLENYEVLGWEHAIRGMRNPMNSWEKSDSVFDCKSCNGCYYSCEVQADKDALSGELTFWCNHYPLRIGPNDLALMMKLRNAGTDHRKFMRMLVVYVDITAPLYWWKEFDTYKVGTVANSCSTMHKIHERDLTIDDFSYESLPSCDAGNEDNYIAFGLEYVDDVDDVDDLDILELTVQKINDNRKKFLETGDKRYWRRMIQQLSSSYNQKRTVMLNYEVLANIYRSRKNHKLDEWRELCKWAETLPYSEIITAPREDTSFQEDLDFFVGECTKAQLKALYERVGEKLRDGGEKSDGT